MIELDELRFLEGPLSTRILVVGGQESGSGSSSALVTALRDDGYDVEVAVGASDCLTRFVDPPALVVLGNLSPGTRWTDVCRAIRAISDVPILMGARPESELEAVLACELGVWGYLSHSGRTRELSARVRAALRMNSEHAIPESTSTELANGNSTGSAGTLEIDVVGRVVKVRVERCTSPAENSIFLLPWFHHLAS